MARVRYMKIWNFITIKKKQNKNKLTNEMLLETYENDVFQNKNKKLHTTIKQKKKLRGHTELLMLPKNKSSNCSLLIHFFYYKKKKEKKNY